VGAKTIPNSRVQRRVTNGGRPCNVGIKENVDLNVLFRDAQNVFVDLADRFGSVDDDDVEGQLLLMCEAVRLTKCLVPFRASFIKRLLWSGWSANRIVGLGVPRRIVSNDSFRSPVDRTAEVVNSEVVFMSKDEVDRAVFERLEDVMFGE
jgi:hypothetical protein